MSGEAACRPTYSFVIPVYNELETLPALRERLVELMDRLDGQAEVVLVDDGSTDGSFESMMDLHRSDPRFKVVRFSRNFGHQVAVSAGLDFARGDAVVVMDADLQDPPEVVLEMARLWREGNEVVYGVRRRRRGENWFKRLSAAAFYRVLRRLTETEMPLDAGDFRLVDRKVVEAVKAMPEANRYLRGLFAWVGFRQAAVSFDRRQRHAGRSKYPLRKMLRLAADGVVGFSRVPLRWPLYAGLALVVVAAVWALAALVGGAGGLWRPSGWNWLAVLGIFLTGLQLTALGILGAYLARVHEEVRRRPLYLVREAHGFDAAELTPGSARAGTRPQRRGPEYPDAR